jgi:hypothetical protein
MIMNHSTLVNRFVSLFLKKETTFDVQPLVRQHISALNAEYWNMATMFQGQIPLPPAWGWENEWLKPSFSIFDLVETENEILDSWEEEWERSWVDYSLPSERYLSLGRLRAARSRDNLVVLHYECIWNWEASSTEFQDAYTNSVMDMTTPSEWGDDYVDESKPLCSRRETRRSRRTSKRSW